MRLIFDEAGKKYYETGVERVVLYRLAAGRYRGGVVWNGVTSVSESPDGGEATDIWADDIKYLQMLSAENYKATIEAYTYPEEFAGCLGEEAIAAGVYAGQQSRKHFGFSYVTKLGNDIKKDDYGYIIHIVYNALAAPSDKSHSTQSDSTEPLSMSWEISAATTAEEGRKPTAVLTLNSRRFSAAGVMNSLRIIEDILYGTEETTATVPTASQIFQAIEYGQNLYDSDGNSIFDSEGGQITSAVYD